MTSNTNHVKRSVCRPESKRLPPNEQVDPPKPEDLVFGLATTTNPQHVPVPAPLPPELWTRVMSHALRTSPEMPDVWRHGRRVSRLVRDATDHAFFTTFIRPLELEVSRDVSESPEAGDHHHHHHHNHWSRVTYSVLRFSHLSPCGGRVHYAEHRERTEGCVFGRERRRAGLWLKWQHAERRRCWPDQAATRLPASRLHMGVDATEPRIVSPILVLSRSMWIKERDLGSVGLEVDRGNRPCEVSFDWRRIMLLSMGEFKISRRFYTVK